MKFVKKCGWYRVLEWYKGIKEEDFVLVFLKYNLDVSKGVEKWSKMFGVCCFICCCYNF